MVTQIEDINSTRVVRGDRYFVDSNVWFWTTYYASKNIVIPNAPSNYQLQEYPNFLQRVIENNALLCHCPLTLSELANVIETKELEIYNHINNLEIERKEFRRIRESRQEVISEIDTAWNTINTMSDCIPIMLDMKFVDKSKQILNEGPLDPYDSFFVQVMRENNIDFIITDDNDFCMLNQGIVLTANRKSLRS